ncbi:MAG: DUF4231 domain-containing protein [Synechococcaceae cyanobacterium]|nr:DUF4231 domain-containing protein [Synechococcaceae cyanobacterium]
MDAQTYLAERVDRQLVWLSQASRDNKDAYRRCRLLSIGLGALIAVLSPYAGRPGPLQPWIPPLLQLCGAGVAIAGSLLVLNRHQENWLRYRSLKETLEREKMLFLTGSSEAYRQPDALQRFVRHAEAIMAEERDRWVQETNERDDDRVVPLRDWSQRRESVSAGEAAGEDRADRPTEAG